MKTASIVCEPAVRLVVEIVDVAVLPLPFNGVPGPRSVVPSKNSTVPIGVPPPVVVSVIVAVNVTDWPKMGVEAGPVSVVVVPAETTCVTCPELGASAPDVGR